MTYEKLQKLLAAGKWREADEETALVILKIANPEEKSLTFLVEAGWLRVEDINHFSCEDLREMDRLWIEYSNSRFGFCVQRQIYQELGGTQEFDRAVWEAFGDRVGWRKEGKWLSWRDLTFKIAAPHGHFPAFGELFNSQWERFPGLGMCSDTNVDRYMDYGVGELRESVSLIGKLLECNI
ncbi:MAG: GUN4 domain-containing protein [Geitlerinemataceae cyanobacterium]